mmetsp:Transcript_7108/g.44014  ORF Transcript_7108/g.44014 Transcript_7108/m.44014 type:complete len:219 (-) Transcript_7108:2900-3556(-)
MERTTKGPTVRVKGASQRRPTHATTRTSRGPRRARAPEAGGSANERDTFVEVILRSSSSARRSRSLQPCARSCTSKRASVGTKSGPSSGRSAATNTASIPSDPTMETATCSSNGSTCTSTKPPVEGTSPEPSSWTWNPEPWTPCVPARLDRSSVPTISSLDRPEPETTGPRDTTPKAQNSSIPCWTWCARKPSPAIACKVSRCATPWAEARGPAWAPS